MREARGSNVKVIEKDNIIIMSIKDNLSATAYLDETPDLNHKEVAFNILWNNRLQKINKGLLFIFHVNGKLYNILFNGNKLVVDEKVKIGDETEEVIIELAKDYKSYNLCQLRHNAIGSTYYQKYFNDSANEFFGIKLSSQEAHNIISSLINDLSEVEGIENIFVLNPLKGILSMVDNSTVQTLKSMY